MYGDCLQISLGMGVCVCVSLCVCMCMLGSSNTQHLTGGPVSGFAPSLSPPSTAPKVVLLRYQLDQAIHMFKSVSDSPLLSE